LPNCGFQDYIFLYLTLKLKVEAPFGTDCVWTFAVDHQVSEVPAEVLENRLNLMSKTIDQLCSDSMALAVQVFDPSSKKIITQPGK
jgi:hypothetical protein